LLPHETVSNANESSINTAGLLGLADKSIIRKFAVVPGAVDSASDVHIRLGNSGREGLLQAPGQADGAPGPGTGH